MRDGRDSLAVGQGENTQLLGSLVGAAVETQRDPNNRSSAAGVLGVILGYYRIPAKYKSG